MIFFTSQSRIHLGLLVPIFSTLSDQFLTYFSNLYGNLAWSIDGIIVLSDVF